MSGSTYFQLFRSLVLVASIVFLTHQIIINFDEINDSKSHLVVYAFGILCFAYLLYGNIKFLIAEFKGNTQQDTEPSSPDKKGNE